MTVQFKQIASKEKNSTINEHDIHKNNLAINDNEGGK